MAPGSVIVDIAAERGGNCELTRPGETFVHHGITIMGPVNLPSALPRDASQLYSSNITALLKLMVQKGELVINRDDQIIRETLVTHEGQVVNTRVRELFGSASAGGEVMKEYEYGLWIFMLAAFLGFQLIRNVSPLLHTPLDVADERDLGDCCGRRHSDHRRKGRAATLEGARLHSGGRIHDQPGQRLSDH